MLERRFLFMAGEWRASMMLAFSDELWSHTTSARLLAPNGDGTFHRNGVRERLEGILYYADVEDETVRRSNLRFLADGNVPCWPDPGMLLELDDRFELMRMCVDAGLVDHPVEFVEWKDRKLASLDEPFVLKVGNLHRGEGKLLIESIDDMEAVPEWRGIASVEPFFVGTSARALFVGKEEFALRYDNPRSWVKNSAGADVEMWSGAPAAMFEHARRVRDRFGLEVCGMDYVVDASGTPHFLEFNCFPGVGADDAIVEAARKVFREKMTFVNSEADRRTNAR